MNFYLLTLKALTLQTNPSDGVVCECCDARLVPEVVGKNESLPAACYMRYESLFTGPVTAE